MAYGKKGVIALALVASLGPSACTMDGQTIGRVAGGVAGAVVGTQFGKGIGQTVAVAIGAAAGQWIGGELACLLKTPEDKKAAEVALESATTAPVGQRVEWNAERSGGTSRGYVQPTKEYKNEPQQQCRDFKIQAASAGGETKTVNRKACLVDGEWKPVSV